MKLCTYTHEARLWCRVKTAEPLRFVYCSAAPLRRSNVLSRYRTKSVIVSYHGPETIVWCRSWKNWVSRYARDQQSRPSCVVWVGIVGGLGGWTPQFMSPDAHFWVKIGFKLQSLGKISNISTPDPPPSSFGSIPTLCMMTSVTHEAGVARNWLRLIPAPTLFILEDDNPM